MEKELEKLKKELQIYKKALRQALYTIELFLKKDDYKRKLIERMRKC